MVRSSGTQRALRVARSLALLGAGAGAGAFVSACAGANAGSNAGSGVTAEGPASGGGALASSGSTGGGRCPETAPTGGTRCTAREMNVGHCSYAGDSGLPTTCICNQAGGPSELAWACVTAVSGPLAPPELREGGERAP